MNAAPIIELPLSSWGRMDFSFVYAYRVPDAGVVKIGHTRNPITRTAGLRGQCPLPVEWARVLWVGDDKTMKATERGLHKDLSAYRTHGEWFTDGPHIYDALDGVCPAVDVTSSFNASNDNPAYFKTMGAAQDISNRIYNASAEQSQ